MATASCRNYCVLMRLELKSVLGQSLDTDGSFFQLFRAAHHLESVAAKWAPGILGERLHCVTDLIDATCLLAA